MNPVTRLRRFRQSDRRDERGAALVEFAIAIPIFIALLALVFDAGLGYSKARSSSSTARTAARVGALAGDDRNADYLVLDALRVQFGDGATVEEIVIYRSDPANPTGTVPDDCTANGACNIYNGSILASLNEAMFTTQNVPGGEWCAGDAPDQVWCPLGRRADDGDYLGVYVRSRAKSTVGIGGSDFGLEDRAVFAMYFPPAPVAP